MNPYPDGRLAEVFLELAQEGSTMRSFGNLVAMLTSLALQHGASVESIVRLLRRTRFEPAGVVEGHDRIKMVSSIADYLARELAITFLGDDEAGQVVPAASVETGEKIVALDRRALGVATTGYTGDACLDCGNTTLKPAGSCLACDSCGATTGCG
jgi:ribonucleoside-diphosphate reductase alpha chain